MSFQAPIVARRQHKKSRNGCRQCKARRVKCDEQKPLCGNCAKHYANMEFCDFQVDRELASIHRGAFALAPRPSKKAPRKSSFQPMHPASSLKAGSIDPFMAHPESNVPDIQEFMHHYFSNFTSKSFPTVLGYDDQPLLNSWWSMASQDEVLFHATLQLSAFDLDAMRSRGQSVKNPPRLHINGECIRLLRKRIEDSELGVSDQTIGSVLFLAIVEFERGNPRMVKMHIEGLKRMVRMRGGLEGIRETNPLLANMIFGISFTVTTTSQFPPTIGQPLPPIRLPGHSFDPNLFDLRRLGVADPCVQVMQELRYMTNATDLTWPRNPPSQHCSDILVRLTHLAISDSEDILTTALTDATRIATTILCFLPFQNDYPSPRLMITTQLHKLKSVLETALELAPPSHELLPYLLGCGGIYAEDELRSWFVGHLVTFATAKGVEDWEQVKPLLVRIAWIEYFCEPVFSSLWEEVRVKKAELEELDAF